VYTYRQTVEAEGIVCTGLLEHKAAGAQE
jgi:hypothetical protein